MNKRTTNEDVMQMRKLFWLKIEGEITQAELEGRVDEIVNKQQGFRFKVLSFKCQNSDLKPKTWNLKPEIEALK